MNMLTLLLENQSQPTLKLRVPPSKQLALREIPSIASTPAKEYEKHWIIQNQSNTAQSPTLCLWYLSSWPWRLASTRATPLQTRKCQYHSKLRWLLRTRSLSNVAIPMDPLTTLTYVPVKTKCIIMKYRTEILYNQKHVVWFKHSKSLKTCPLCPQLDSALHILFGCKHSQ